MFTTKFHDRQLNMSTTEALIRHDSCIMLIADLGELA